MKKAISLLSVIVVVMFAVSYAEPADFQPEFSQFVHVEGGTFMMGDEFWDLWGWCRPVHEVTLTYDFVMGKYEVTFEEYDAFCDETERSIPEDRGWGRGQRPAFNVSWWDAIAYCNWLSEKEDLSVAYRLLGEPDEGQLLDEDGNVTEDVTLVKGYRLPTEAEWEYAARGGNKSEGYKYSGSNDVDNIAWFVGNSGYRTQEVGNKEPNELGIYDLSGNVWEWCTDRWYMYTHEAETNPYFSDEAPRVIRGGALVTIADDVRVAYREYKRPAHEDYKIGFRLVRTVQ